MAKVTKVEKDGIRARKASIETRIRIITALVCAAAVIVFGVIVYFITYNRVMSASEKQAISIAQVAASQIDGTKHDEIASSGNKSTDYDAMVTELDTYKNASIVKNIYTVKPNADGGIFYVVDTDQNTGAAIGDAMDGDIPDALMTALEGEASAEGTESKGEGVITGYAPILNSTDNIVGLVAVDCDSSDVSENMRNVMIYLAIAAIIVMLIAGGLGVLIARVIVRNLKLVNSKLVDVVYSGEGDLTRKIDINSGDEVEVISDNLNEMIEQVRKVVESVKNISYTLNDGAEEIADVMESANLQIKDITVNMDDMSRASSETTQSLSKVIDSNRNIVVATKEIERNISTSANVAQHITSDTAELKTKVDEFCNNTERQTQELERLVEEKLNQSHSVERIHKLTGDILSITGQTNLLALNASIEAARAGEHGKGFAVVASEIGALADQSNKAAKQIQEVSELVTTAVDELSDVTKDMLNFIRRDIMKGYRTVASAGDRYAQDATSINEAMNRVMEQAGALAGMVTEIEEVMTSIAAASEENTAGIANVAELTLILKDFIRETTEMTVENRGRIEKMNRAIGKYKVD